MSKRDAIRLTPDEITAYLKASRTMTLVSNGKDGFPHPMPMWYAVDDAGAIYMTTFRKSQKIANLRRDAKVALLVESGDAYAELKGLVIYAEAELLESVEATKDVLVKVAKQRGEAADATAQEGMLKTAEKRIGIKFKPAQIVSWDHAKLGGAY